VIRVLSAGMFTTVQDLGRPGYCHVGVSAAGAADSVALRVANRLVGNAEGAPAFEMTLLGGRYEFLTGAVVSVCGGDFECRVPLWQAVGVAAGQVVEIGGCRSGARCYLAVRGGLKADYYLGSASTHVLGGLGRPVQKGEQFGLGSCVAGPVPGALVDRRLRLDRIRVVAGSESDSFSGLVMLRFLTETWRVSEQSNRQGVRLHGVKLVSPGGGVMESEGVGLGAVQIPPGGDPVILFVDSQTTGGYPVIANVALVDLPVVGQLCPGAEFRFETVSFVEARALLLEQEAWIRAV
jgi:antagonist of KipI